ncbi:MAG TPA: formate dehydrogenase accessory sulfurtransferase FdhD [Steroidobacteraceae bacterium]|nr:formate dehydrogenase accessory sulfurtransferase FdhD [Steroidobacteraceae bacterium]
MRPVPNAPRITAASCAPLREVVIVDEQGDRRAIEVPVERSLTVFVDGRELVTLMTLGACPEMLILGYLRNQRVLGDVTMVESLAVDWDSGSGAVRTRGGLPGGPDAAGVVGTACALGTVFEDLMRQVDATALPQAATARISRSTLLDVIETMRHHDAIHRAAGSVHSCALFRGSELLVSIEDVSRHNGLDTVAGWMAFHGVAGGDKILFTTGRLTGEMVMKAAHNGIPIAISRNGVTAMGYDLAVKLGMTLFGRAANRRFLCYTGAERLDPEAGTAGPR